MTPGFDVILHQLRFSDNGKCFVRPPTSMLFRLRYHWECGRDAKRQRSAVGRRSISLASFVRCALRGFGPQAEGSLSHPARHRWLDSKLSTRNAAGRFESGCRFSGVSSTTALLRGVDPLVARISAEFFEHSHACCRPGALHHCRLSDSSWKVAARL